MWWLTKDFFFGMLFSSFAIFFLYECFFSRIWCSFTQTLDTSRLSIWQFLLIQKKSQKCDLFNNFFIGLILRRALNQRAFIWRKFNKIESWQHKMWHSPFANSFSKEKRKCSDNSDFARSKNRKVFYFQIAININSIW